MSREEPLHCVGCLQSSLEAGVVAGMVLGEDLLVQDIDCLGVLVMFDLNANRGQCVAIAQINGPVIDICQNASRERGSRHTADSAKYPVSLRPPPE